MEFGDILKVIGEFGRFQKWLVLLISIPHLFNAFHFFSQVFMVMDVPHYCNTSWIRKLHWNLTEEQELNLTIPRKPDGSFEQCQMFTPVEWSNQSILLNSTEKCRDGWVYPEQLQPTLLTEFNMVCERKKLKDISQSIYMAGVLTGALVFGPLGDRIGSRKMGLLVFPLMSFFSVGTGFAPNLYVYIAFRFIVGSTLAGSGISMTALGSEWLGASYRPFFIIAAHCCSSMGQMAVAGLAYNIQDWRLYQFAGSAPVLCFLFYIWVLPSSARWLLTRGKAEEAKKEIRRAALINKRTIPEELLNQLGPPNHSKSESILDLLKKPYLRKITLIMAWIWFVDSLVYYGVSLRVGNFGLDIYVTQIAFGTVEIPARFSCIFLLRWLGRKKTQAGCLLLAGVVCLVIPAVPKTFPVIVTALAVIGKAAIAASFSSTYVFSAELFPTVLRQTCLGLCSVSARIGGILAPLAGLLDEIHPAISMVLFGSTALLGGILCFFLPETRDRDLPDDTTRLPFDSKSNKIVDGAFEHGRVEEKDRSWITETTTSTCL